MSDKSGNSSQAISLPKGGGALRGIGEKFAPDLHTGTGNFTVPISLPPGRGGFQPELNLVYSTGNGNGPFGLGWGLSIPGVVRKTSKGVPRYGAEDVFVLSGAEDLVPVERPPGGTRYRPRTEGLFARILHHHGGNQWEVRSKDGLVSFYGSVPGGLPGAAEDDPAVVADPADRGRVFDWRLVRTVDPFGNRIEYEYERDLRGDGSRRWDQLYPKRVLYADYEDAGTTRFLVSVTFEYEDRPDPFSDYRAGFEIRTRKRCSSIEVRTHAGEERLVRSYRLVYLDRRGGKEHLLPPNGVSLLDGIRVVGHDGDLSEELPPLEFGYTAFEPGGRRYRPFSTVGDHVPDRSLAHAEYELVDLFGDGLPDVVQMNGTTRYWRNLGDGRFGPPRAMRNAPADAHLQDPGVQMADMNGDGRADLLVTDGLGRGGYYPLDFEGEWDRRGYVPYRRSPSVNLEDPDTRLVDLDGDGVVDALRTGASFELYYNEGYEGGWTGVELRRRGRLDAFPDVSFGDGRVKLADMSGDGLQDVVLVHDGRVDYWPYMGYGRWGRRVTMRGEVRFEDGGTRGGIGYDPKRVLLGDVDGDGCADLVYVGSGRVTVWINRGGDGWSEPITVRGTPPMADSDAVRLADMHGTGTDGILWTYDQGTQRESTYKFLDLTGGTKPYVLSEMDNHAGSKTRVEYAPSTRFYLEDQRRPETRWKTPLPFPVQVVSRVEALDGISGGKLTTEYRYHHGYWDGAEREFRGFGMVEQRDTETFTRYNGPGLHGTSTAFAGIEDPARFSPPTLTKTWFHQGPVDEGRGVWREPEGFEDEFWRGDPQVLPGLAAGADDLHALRGRARRDALRALRGRVLRTELYALDGTGDLEGRPYTVTEHLYGVRVESPQGEAPGERETDRPHVFFPHELAQRTTRWERGEDPMTRFGFTGGYDEHGQPRRQTQVSCPRGWRTPGDTPTEPYLATRGETVYARPKNPRLHIVDRVARTTTYEITATSGKRVLDVKDTPDGAALKVIGQTLHFYDRDPSRPENGAFLGLPYGEVGDYGAPARTETLTLTDEILQKAYGDETPPFLKHPGPPAWTPDYPAEFRASLPALAGYTYYPGGAGAARAAGYFVSTERRRYDFHDDPEGKGRGMVKARRDPLGHEATISYDESYDLLPVEATDPAGLKTEAGYDYRVLQPREVTDPNGNRTRFAFTPLGLLRETWTVGNPAKNEGDRQRPGVRIEYDFLAYEDSGRPISVRTISRVHHDTETDVPLPQRDETITTVEYSDGFGRLLQARTQAEDIAFGDDPTFGNRGLPVDQPDPGGDAVGSPVADPVARPRVVVSGWQVYDNKGRVVEKYEPFFSEGWEYAPPAEAQLGQKAVMSYDPRGQVVRTLNPDGSEQRVVYGVPSDLSNPDAFVPTPWETYTYDANDNSGRTHSAASAGYQNHRNTPTSAVMDALGRTVRTVERNGPDPTTDWYVTRSAYDIGGNLLTVTDPLGRTALKHVYDLANRALRTEQLDTGPRRVVVDAAGNAVEQRDGKGALALRALDEANRPTRLWGRDGAGQTITLRERLIYGDDADSGLTAAQAAEGNLLGKPYKYYDEAGLLTFEAYDFKGNVREKARQVIGDAAILAVFANATSAPVSTSGTRPQATPRRGGRRRPPKRPPAPPPQKWRVKAFRVDWQPPAGTTPENHARGLLDPTVYRTSLAYDALNRVKAMLYPQDVGGGRKELRPRYNRAGALERVELDGKVYVERIAYNARGQRVLIAYGNGVMTRHAYDPKTFRLLRMRTERYTKPGTLSYHPTGAPLQDLAYEYDLAGNLLALRDRTPGSGLATKPDSLDRAFAYDPLYRLLSATGRECDVSPPPPWNVQPRCADVTRTRSYTQTFQYDPAGNLKRLRHQAKTGAFTRDVTLAPNSNRLATMAVGGKSYAYAYDPSGNLIQENGSRHFEWDHADRMRVYRTQVGDAEPSVHAHYLYDSGGQRVKKLVRKSGQVEVTVYIDGAFEHHRTTKGTTTQENNVLHVMDDQSRIALARVGQPFSDDTTPAVKYHLGDHLGSSNMVIDDAGSWVNREEYTPYGETSFGGFARKSYRFAGKERDEESGLYYHGARYYAPWLSRWVNCDPAGMVDGLNLYAYVRGRPLNMVDPSGRNGAAPAVSQVPAPASNERYAVDTYANQSKIPQSERVGGQNLQGHHPHQEQWAKENIVGYDPNKAPTQFLETKGNPDPELRGEHTKISVDQNRNRPAGGDWGQKSTSQAFTEAAQQYQDAGLLTDKKQGLKALLESAGHFFGINDEVTVDPTTGKPTVTKNAKLAEHLQKAEELAGAALQRGKQALGAAGEVAGKVTKGVGKALSVVPVGDVLDVLEMQEHHENRTLPGLLGLWTWVTPQSRNLDYPDGTPVRDIGGREVGVIQGGRVLTYGIDYL